MGRVLQEVSCVILVAGFLLHASRGAAAECDGADQCSAVDSFEEPQPWKGQQLLQQNSTRSLRLMDTDPTSMSTEPEMPSVDGEAAVAAHGLALSQQGLFPKTCRSIWEKFEYAAHIALHCGAALKKVWKCLTELDNPLTFMECVKVFKNNTECQNAEKEACGSTEPKCCRCKTTKPMPSNQKPGCLLEIYRGDSCHNACKLLDVSSGRYRREWFRSGKNNYRFYGKCDEAEQKGGAKFTQHERCPTP